MPSSQPNATLRFIHTLRTCGESRGDAELVARVALGDELAFEALVRRHGPLVLAAGQDRYVKLRVVRHQDNDAVEIEWAPMEMPKRKG